VTCRTRVKQPAISMSTRSALFAAHLCLDFIVIDSKVK